MTDLAVFGDVLGDLEVAEGPGALGVHDSLGDPLAVKVRDLVDVDKVLKGGTREIQTRGGR